MQGDEVLTMQRRYALAVLAPFVLGSLAVLGGCGGDSGTETVTNTPEAVKADTSAQNGMMEYMQTKTKSKAKTSAPAEAPKKTP